MIETKDAETPRTRKSAKLRIVRLAFVLAVLATPVLLFFAASALVNRTRIPTEMEKMPPDLAALLAPSSAGGSSVATPGVASVGTAPIVANTPTNALPPEGGAPEEFGFPVAHRTHADLAPTPTFKGSGTYDAFLEAELRERPELEGARLYLDLCRRFQTPEGKQELSGFDYGDGKRLWQPGHPLPPICAEWLAAHTETVGQFLRFAESSCLPLRTGEAIAHDPDLTVIHCPNFSVLSPGQRILAAEGQRRLEAGDTAGAERHWRAAIRLAANLGGEPYTLSMLFGARALSDAVLPVASWVGANGVPRETLTGLRRTLAEAHRCMFPFGLAAQEAATYPADRRMLVSTLNDAPWNSRVFLWNPDEILYFSDSSNSITVFGHDLPRLDRLATSALRAMRLKRATPRILSEFDRAQVEANRRERMPWPELAVTGPLPRPEELRLFTLGGGYPVTEGDYTVLVRLLQSETQLNLLRAAIEWRLASADAKPDPAAMTIADRESPWRDPFAEAPLHATVLPSGDDGDDSNHARGGVLLYSLGPDLQDQQGQIEYDPTNGTVSAGDLTLEVKH